MKTEERRICRSCGNEFSGATELCPVCMLRGVMGEEGQGFSESTIGESTLEMAVGRYEHYEVVKGKDGNLVELGRGAMGLRTKHWMSLCDAR
jgi:hypothetical protein